MNISKYDFHDGYLIDIISNNNDIEMYMESAQIDLDDLRDSIPLSKNRTIKGKLYLKNIKSIKINNRYIDCIKKLSDDGEIYQFTINQNKVILIIIWQGSDIENPWCTYEIEAGTIYWETIPDLHNPYWE